jgi:putative transposase
MDGAITKEGVDPNQLTIHADNGASMASHGVAEFLATLGVRKSHSRPHTSNDNPYSEAQFKTLKYRGDFPERFETIEEARTFFGVNGHVNLHAHGHLSCTVTDTSSAWVGMGLGG